MVHIHAYTLTDLHIVPYLYPLRALPDQRQHPDTLMMMRKLGAALGRDWGGAGRGTAARARNRPFSAPHARNGVGIGSGVCVCAKCCCLAVPLSWLQCRLVTPWPPRHSAVETRGCGASHMGARRPPYPARVGENWQANPQLTTTGPFRPSVDRRRDLLGGR